VNPFVVDSPAAPSDLIDRERELEQLLALAEGGHNVRLSAPRRYGKTTLLDRVREEAEALGLAAVYVDCFGVLSLGELAARIDAAYTAGLKGPLTAWYNRLRRSWRVRLRAGVPGLGADVESLAAAEAEAVLDELLDLPRKVFDRSGKRTLVQFDEFQDVLAASDRTDAAIRARIQHHRAEAAYLFAGSHPGLMAELFGDRERPFYGQARAIRLGPLPDEPLAEYIDARFRDTGRELGWALDPLLDLARGHPQRAMLLAHHLWEAVPAGQAADADAWERCAGAVIEELNELYERTWARLSVNERRTYTAIAWIGPRGGGSTLLAGDTLSRFQLKKSTARTLARELELRGETMVQDGRPRLVDPLFEVWILSKRVP
jgi:uncharacterized protein